jgi:hypothetical protein
MILVMLVCAFVAILLVSTEVFSDLRYMWEHPRTSRDDPHKKRSWK